MPRKYKMGKRYDDFIELISDLVSGNVGGKMFFWNNKVYTAAWLRSWSLGMIVQQYRGGTLFEAVRDEAVDDRGMKKKVVVTEGVNS